MVGVVVFFDLCFSLAVIMILAEVLLPAILRALQTPQEIFNDAYGYLSIYLLGYVFLYLYVQFTSIFRAYGDPMLQMKECFLQHCLMQ